MIELLKIISGVAGSITTILGCALLLIKPFRKWFLGMIQKKVKDVEQDHLMLEIRNTLQKHIENDQENQKNCELQSNALLCILRNNITKTYFKHMKADGIPNYERENIVKQYMIYHKMNGNSYVDIIYQELLDIPIIK